MVLLMLMPMLQLLEEHFGRPLFEKKGRKLVLTDTGELAYSYAQDIFNLGADVIMQLDELVEGGSDLPTSRAAMERSLRWLERCRVEFDRITRNGRAPLDQIPLPIGTPPA